MSKHINRNSMIHVLAKERGTSTEEADLAYIKVKLCAAIRDSIKLYRLTQTDAAALAGVSQARISAAVRGRQKEFTTDMLIQMLKGINDDIQVSFDIDIPEVRQQA